MSVSPFGKSRNTCVKSIQVRSKLFSTIEQFAKFLKDNCKFVTSPLNTSPYLNDDIFVSEALVDGIYMNVPSAPLDQLSIRAGRDGFEVTYNEWFPESDEIEAHFETLQTECFTYDHAREAMECFMQRWNSNPAKASTVYPKHGPVNPLINHTIHYY